MEGEEQPGKFAASFAATAGPLLPFLLPVHDVDLNRPHIDLTGHEVRSILLVVSVITSHILLSEPRPRSGAFCGFVGSGGDLEHAACHHLPLTQHARKACTGTVLSSYRRECRKCHSKWEDYLPYKRCFCLRWEAKPLQNPQHATNLASSGRVGNARSIT